MIAELGAFSLALSLLLAIGQSATSFAGVHTGQAALARFARRAALMQLACLVLSFLALVTAFARSDFSVALVALHSHSAKPLLYRITGTWGNHEGSLLMWNMALALFGAGLAFAGHGAGSALRLCALGVQGLTGAAFVGLSLFTSNPFSRLDPPVRDGEGLNPVLQDIALAAHPPLLYLGYAGLSAAFSLSVAGLIRGQVGTEWARALRPFALAGWVALTLGIALGSYWAYYELGWGGWWFWDPVENASLMPWLLASALLHSVKVGAARGMLQGWTALLAILAFAFALIGTFIVRSGLLTSVHAFASDPERGAVILAMLAITLAGALGLYGWRAPGLGGPASFAIISRESAILLNNLLLCAAAATVCVGTLYPLALELLTGARISVGPPFFSIAFLPLVAPLLALLPIGAMLPWKRGDGWLVVRRLYGALALSLIAGAAGVWAAGGSGKAQIVATGFLLLGLWVLFGALSEMAEPLLRKGARLRHLARAPWGKALAHAGLGISALGMASVSGWQQEAIGALRPSEWLELPPYRLRLEQITRTLGPNYQSETALFTLWQKDKPIARLFPERRHYIGREAQTTEVAIDSRLTRDIYLVLGTRVETAEGVPTNRWNVRAWRKPFAILIWLGALTMAAGGAVCLWTRRRTAR